MNLQDFFENIDREQRRVKQLPADFAPANTSPQLAGPYPGRNATRGYLVGEGRDLSENPMAQAVTRRIMNQHPEWLTRYGVEAVMQVIDNVTQGEEDWEEIGSSDISAYVNMVRDRLTDWAGSREEMRDRRPFAEQGVAEATGDRAFDDMMRKIKKGTKKQATADRREREQQSRERARAAFGPSPADKLGTRPAKGVSEAGYNPLDAERREQRAMDQERAQFKRDELEFELRGEEERMRAYNAGVFYLRIDGRIWRKNGDPVAFQGRDRAQRAGQTIKDRDPRREVVITRTPQDKASIAEGQDPTYEDILTGLQRKLGDYLQDVATAVKKDPDLLDKMPQDVRDIQAVKTIRTDDGHEIKIHGNEDDGFRISIRDKDIRSQFRNLDEAVIACEMYCSRRRQIARESYSEEDYAQAMRDFIARGGKIEKGVYKEPKLGTRIRRQGSRHIGKGSEGRAGQLAGRGANVALGGKPVVSVEEEKKDACYHKVKSRYKVWPSAYASGALVQCRKKGAKNWGTKS